MLNKTKKYAMTVPVDKKIYAVFVQACRNEKLSISRGFEIALECVLYDDVEIQRDVQISGHPTCFNIDMLLVVQFRRLTRNYLSRSHFANCLMVTALREGFGSTVKATRLMVA